MKAVRNDKKHSLEFYAIKKKKKPVTIDITPRPSDTTANIIRPHIHWIFCKDNGSDQKIRHLILTTFSRFFFFFLKIITHFITFSRIRIFLFFFSVFFLIIFQNTVSVFLNICIRNERILPSGLRMLPSVTVKQWK